MVSPRPNCSRYIDSGAAAAVCTGYVYLLNPVGVKVGLIDTHSFERGGVIVVLLLFDNQLCCVITCKRSWHLGTRREWF